MDKHLIDTLDERIRNMKPNDKSNFSKVDGTLISKKEVIEEIRKLRSISVGEMIKYLNQFDDNKEIFVRTPNGKQYNIWNMHNTELQIVKRDTGEIMNFQ